MQLSGFQMLIVKPISYIRLAESIPEVALVSPRAEEVITLLRMFELQQQHIIQQSE